ncbi:DUF4397 domain-containing protein [Ideonella sp.]|uniref:DUF4397 domain-containing protein n=1 Tax=Ideonella sp. TaxID=1929293 RepID=UPI002B49C445|nr:DUF4397 domain-containing protein [Ideonella sp.]HJV68127.1 DUF4397 domain-containing protein [Ideonella sp.]
MRMNKRHLLGLVAALPLAWLTACGGGDSNDATVRLVNASPGYAALDLYVADTVEASDVAFGAGSDYTNVKSGEVSNVLTAAGSTTELLNQTRSLGSGKKYTIVAYGWEGALKSVIMTDDESAADSNKTKVSVLNTAIDAGELDVYLTGTDESLESSTPIASGVDAGSQSGFSSVASGTYRLRVTGAGDTEDLRLDIPSITLDSTKVLTLVMAPGSGGVLVHAIGVIQDGAVTPYLNTQARVRMVAAVATVPTFSRVSVTAGDTILGSNVGSFTIKDYVLLNAGALTLHTSVDGTALADQAVTVAAGADLTLLVTGGSAADAQVKVIADDNRLPTVSTKYKIRLIHAAPTLASQNLSMTVDATDVVSDLPFGSASSFDDRTASSAAVIDISTPTQGTIYELTDQSLLSKGVYTVFMFDGVNGAYARVSPSR